MKHSSDMTPDELTFAIADLFFREKKKLSDIAKALGLTREAIYPAIQRLRDLNAIQYLPPLKQTTAEQLITRYHLDTDALTVVDANDDPTGEHFASVVANLALRAIKKVGRARPGPVGLGLGPGRGTLEVARHLGNLMRSDPETPQLRLVIISSACPATCPEYAPVAFLNLFPNSAVETRIGLFAEPIVAANTFKRLATRPGVREAFEAKPLIDVVITSMGNAEDEHDLLTTLMKQAGEDIRALKRHRGIGNVMYRPYNEDGPIHEQGSEQRAVTLFELEDFVQMSHTRGKHVILLARTCDMCGKTKARSLKPLLESPKLRVWSHVVMDVKSANDLTSSAQG